MEDATNGYMLMAPFPGKVSRWGFKTTGECVFYQAAFLPHLRWPDQSPVASLRAVLHSLASSPGSPLLTQFPPGERGRET